MKNHPQTTPDFKAEAEKIGDATIEFLKDESELPIHTDDRWAVIMDIQQALIDAYNAGVSACPPTTGTNP